MFKRDVRAYTHCTKQEIVGEERGEHCVRYLELFKAGFARRAEVGEGINIEERTNMQKHVNRQRPHVIIAPAVALNSGSLFSDA